MGSISGIVFVVAVASLGSAQAATLSVKVDRIDATGVAEPAGTVVFTDTPAGLRIEPNLRGLPPGPHGFHIHANGDCGITEQNGQKVAGGAAGSHFDPAGTGKHRGPEETGGHLGDLPVLSASDAGLATTTVVAPHLKTADLHGHAVIVHAGGDNYADAPAPLGGGGSRILCGVIEAATVPTIVGEWLLPDDSGALTIGETQWLHPKYGEARIRPSDGPGDLRVFYQERGVRCFYRTVFLNKGDILSLEAASGTQDPDLCPTGALKRLTR